MTTTIERSISGRTKEAFVNKSVVLHDRLNHIWSLYGYPQATIEKRNDTMFKHQDDLYDEMLSEEEKRLQEKRDEIIAYQKTIEKLCKDLEEEVPKLSFTTLLQQGEELLSYEKELREKKAEKMKEWIELKREEKSLREDLGEEVVGDIEDFDGIPGKKDIQSLNAVLIELSDEKTRRFKEFGKIKIQVRKLHAMLEKEPSSEIERMITAESTLPRISLELLAKCKDLESSFQSKVESNRLEVERLRVEIEELKRRLKDEPEADGVSLPEGYTPSVLVEIRVEHGRLIKLKMSNLAIFMEKVRLEIEQLSESVYKKPLMPDLLEPTEEALHLHEQILESLKTYQIEHKKLLELWRKRESVWTQWIEYEAKADDPNRFNNRGGTLLKEEKIRKGLEKSLPKLEKEIMSLAQACPAFKVFGKDVKALIEDEWANFNRDKEEKKMLKKQQTGTNNTMNITRKRPMTPGTGNNGTPAGKRGKLMPVTPVKLVPTTPKRTLRSSSSKDNLPPSPTYSEFTSYKQIFQSTMNEQKGSMAKPKTPPRGRVLPNPKMTPREIKDRF